MSKFYVGQKVLVTGSSYYGSRDRRGTECLGRVCKVKCVRDTTVDVFTPDESDWWVFRQSDLQPITETPETLTINGVEYIRKPDTVVEHEWKIGDVAMHEKYGVGIVTLRVEYDGDIQFRFYSGKSIEYVRPSSLTFIRRADLSV